MRRMTGELKDYFAVIREMLDAHALPWPEEAVRWLYEERVREKRIIFRNICRYSDARAAEGNGAEAVSRQQLLGRRCGGLGGLRACAVFR
jgi:hypothetical protein